MDDLIWVDYNGVSFGCDVYLGDPDEGDFSEVLIMEATIAVKLASGATTTYADVPDDLLDLCCEAWGEEIERRALEAAREQS